MSASSGSRTPRLAALAGLYNSARTVPLTSGSPTSPGWSAAPPSDRAWATSSCPTSRETDAF